MMQRRSVRIAGLSILLLAFLAFCYSLREIFNPFLLSLLIAYVLNPVVDFFERVRVRRGVTILSMYLLLGGLTAVLLLFALPVLVDETVGLYNATFRGDDYEDLNHNGKHDPGTDLLTRDVNGNGKYDVSYVEKVRAWAAGLIEKWNQAHPERKIDLDALLAKLQASLGGTPQEVTATSLDLTGRAVSLIGAGVTGTLTVISYLLLLPIYTFFLLREMPTIKHRIQAYLPATHRTRILDILHRIHRAVSSFFRGKLIICIIKGLLTYVGLYFVDVRFPLIFGVVQAGASLVPFLVLVVGLVPALVVALLDHGLHFGPLFGCLMVFLVAEGLEGFVLTPWVLGKETGLHPVVLILSLLIGGQLFGLFGLILAVPVVSIIGILGSEFVLPPLKELAAEPPPAPPPAGGQ